MTINERICLLKEYQDKKIQLEKELTLLTTRVLNYKTRNTGDCITLAIEDYTLWNKTYSKMFKINLTNDERIKIANELIASRKAGIEWLEDNIEEIFENYAIEKIKGE